MKKIMIVLGIGLIFCGMLTGCRKSEKKYIGKYIFRKAAPQIGYAFEQQLEIKQDGTYRLESSEISGGQRSTPTVTTGEWKIDKDGIVLYVGQSRIPKIIGEIKGNTLIDRLGGETFVKQE